MTFTEFLSDPSHLSKTPSFLQLVRHDALWPSQSNRLEDFEAFLASRLEEEGEGAIPRATGPSGGRSSRRTCPRPARMTSTWPWQRGATTPPTLRAPAPAAWPTGVRWRRSCSRRAIEESRFDDSYLTRLPAQCPAEEDEESDDPDLDDEAGEWDDEDPEE